MDLAGFEEKWLVEEVHELARNLEKVNEQATVGMTLAWGFRSICSACPTWLRLNNVHALLASSTLSERAYVGKKVLNKKYVEIQVPQSLQVMHTELCLCGCRNLLTTCEPVISVMGIFEVGVPFKSWGEVPHKSTASGHWEDAYEQLCSS